MSEPELRTTPAGTPVLRLLVDCGEADEELRLTVVMTGERGRALKSRLKAGRAVKVSGTLRPLARVVMRAATEPGVEVQASELEPSAGK